MSPAPLPHVHFNAVAEDTDKNEIFSSTSEIIKGLTFKEAFEQYKVAIADEFVTTESTTKYTFDEHAHTETIKYEAVLRNNDNHFNLTVDMWSCYCTPLNENSEPPF